MKIIQEREQKNENEIDMIYSELNKSAKEGMSACGLHVPVLYYLLLTSALTYQSAEFFDELKILRVNVYWLLTGKLKCIFSPNSRNKTWKLFQDFEP
jgi:hypothetical protein